MSLSISWRARRIGGRAAYSNRFFVGRFESKPSLLSVEKAQNSQRYGVTIWVALSQAPACIKHVSEMRQATAVSYSNDIGPNGTAGTWLTTSAPCDEASVELEEG